MAGKRESGDVIGQIQAVAARVAASYGLEIFDVQFRREAQGMVLRVRIDRPGPASTAAVSSSFGRCQLAARTARMSTKTEDFRLRAFPGRPKVTPL